MASPEKRTISLPAEQAGSIDAPVGFGAYATASEVVRAGLRALRERDAAVERWLREQVVPVYDAMRVNPDLAIPADQVVADLHAKRVRTDGRGEAWGRRLAGGAGGPSHVGEALAQADGDIDVGVGTGVPARDRAEDGQARHAGRLQLRLVRAQRGDDGVRVQEAIMRRRPAGFRLLGPWRRQDG